MYTVQEQYMTAVKNGLTEKFGDAIVEYSVVADMPQLVVAKSRVADILQHLHEAGFSFLTDLCGVQYPDRELAYGVVYHLHNMVKNQRIRVKAFMPATDITLPTATSVFSSANWMERETFDFYGIEFVGHPNLTRILNVDEMDYFPMRKEYALEDGTRTDKDDSMFGR